MWWLVILILIVAVVGIVAVVEERRRGALGSDTRENRFKNPDRLRPFWDKAGDRGGPLP